MVGQPLKHVADVDHQRTLGRIDCKPFALLGQQFEPGLLGAEQQGDEVDVLVCPGTNRAALGIGHRRIVQQPQHRVTIVDRRIEPAFVQPQPHCDAGENRCTDAVEIGVKHFECPAKASRLRGPDVRWHRIGQRVTSGQIAPDVPEFLQVVRFGPLGDLGAERGIAARAALAGDQIAALFRLGQREELRGQIPRTRDQRRIEAVVLDHRKAEGGEAIAQIAGEGIGCVGERQHGKGGKVHGIVRKGSL